MINTPENINIFIAYSKEDVEYLDALKTQLSVLERIGLVDKIWYDGLIEAGMNWKETILNALHNSDIILLLVSADFIASDFSYEKEMQEAIRLHEEGKVKTIPVIVRQCLWEQTPFGKLKVLPEGGFPIVSSHWKTAEEPYVQVAEAVQKMILAIKKQELLGDQEQVRATFTTHIEEGDRDFKNQDWAKAQEQYKEALMLFQPGFQPTLLILNQKIEDCQNELLYRLQFEKGERAYRCDNHKEAIRYFEEALSYKPADSTAIRFLNNSKLAFANTTISKDEKTLADSNKETPTKFLQIKIFGIEVFKLVMAFSVIGIGLLAGNQFLNSAVYYTPRMENGNLTYINDRGEVAIQTSFIDGKAFTGTLAAVKNKAGKWGFINKKKEVKVPFNYDKAWAHSEKEKLAYVQRAGKCGFIDMTGTEVIPLEYQDAASFNEGLAMVKKGNGSFAFINKKGKEMISGLDSVITKQFKQNEAVVIKDGKEMTINRTGKCMEGCDEFSLPKEDRDRVKKQEQLLDKGNELYEKGDYNRALLKLKEAKRYAQTPEEERKIANRMDLVKRKLDAAGKRRLQPLIKEADQLFDNKKYRAALIKYNQILKKDPTNFYLKEQIRKIKEQFEKGGTMDGKR